jgi:hypothetical protein
LAEEFNAVPGRGDDVRPLMYGVHKTIIHRTIVIMGKTVFQIYNLTRKQ